MNKDNLKKVEFLLKNTKAMVLATNKGVGIVGSEVDILTSFGMLLKQLKEIVNEEALKEACRIAFLSDEELEIEMKEDKKDELKIEVKKLIENLEEIIGVDKDE